MRLPLARHESLVVQDLGDEFLICDTETFRAFCLNKTAAEVWRLCDGKSDSRQIAASLSNKLGTPVSDEIVWLALDQLSKEKLLQNPVFLTEKYGGVTRREVIRRVGFASLVALPVISSLVMPTAAMAQSLGSCAASPFAVGCACTSGFECDSGCCFNNVCEADIATCQGYTCGLTQTCPPGLTCCNPTAPGNGATCSTSGFC